MMLVTKETPAGTQIVVKGSILTIKDTADIRQAVSQLLLTNEQAGFEIVIEDSATLPSTCIGFLLKIANSHTGSFTITIRNEQLYRTMLRMRLNAYLPLRPFSGSGQPA